MLVLDFTHYIRVDWTYIRSTRSSTYRLYNIYVLHVVHGGFQFTWYLCYRRCCNFLIFPYVVTWTT